MHRVRILVFHGYLLRGTGSNVYNANVTRALASRGHEVHLLAQDSRADALSWVDALGHWEDGELRTAPVREPARITVYRPDIGTLLPVYVADTYEGFDSRPFPDLTDAELDAYVEANVLAVRDVAERAGIELALANHLVMGPAILSRALAGTDVPYAVKVHGSALEYTVKPHPARFLPYAREGLASARGVLVGSRHTAESLWAAVPEPGLRERTRLGPPGVDVHVFRPAEPAAATAELVALGRDLLAQATADGPGEVTGSAFDRDLDAVAAAIGELAAGEGPLVTFVGKLIVSKGVDLLVAAWPLVAARTPEARLALVGFGAYREGLERLASALAAGDLAAARALAEAGRAEEGGPRAPLGHLVAFLDGLEADPAARDAYLAAAPALTERVTGVGRLEHGELARLLPACAAQVVPSTFPEAFGMVAAEAAACGVLPLSAAHSGLAEVTATLAPELPEAARPWLSFGVDDGAVAAIADRLGAWLAAPADLREGVRTALREVAEARYGWERVADGVVLAAQGELDALPPVPSDSIPAR
jgi:glycosyltransferase involved in cell wall biosynthesis